MVDDVRAQLAELKQSVDAVAGECHDIKTEQARSADSHKQLHQEHSKLVDRLVQTERKVDLHLLDYSRMQERNEIIHTHMHEATVAVRDELVAFRGEFREHDRTEEQDRKAQTIALRDTIKTVIVTGVTILLALAGTIVTLLVAL